MSSKRTASTADLDPAPIASTSSAPPTSAPSPIAEWQPAAGESPAEREKRIKREKRAARLGVPVEVLKQNPVAPLSVPISAYPQPAPSSEFTPYDPNAEKGQGIMVHPSRLGVSALAREEEKKVREPKEKTAARKRYLKNKLVRAKGRKAGLPKTVRDGSRAGSSIPAGSVVDGAEEGGQDSDAESTATGVPPSSASAAGGELDPEALARKQAVIAEKKAQRKLQRDARKAELRALKAAGAPLPPPAKRVIAPTPTRVLPQPTTTTRVIPEPKQEPTEEELKLKAEKEQEAIELAARKEAKRLKRSTRRLSPVPGQDADAEVPDEEAMPDEPVVDDKEEVAEEAKEPGVLLRLPGATRPAPPSAATLSALKVHASVRDKQVVDPELRLPISELGVSARGVERLAELGFTEAFAG